jgi:hypothetical protein
VSEMVERIARAIFDGQRDTIAWDSLKPEFQAEYRDDARAAIAAMREPTFEMSEAAFRIEAAGHSQRTLIEAAWRAMIDEALRTDPDKPAKAVGELL